MPLDDELSDIRYAPREILARAIRMLAEMVVDVSGGAYSKALVLSEVGLMDGEAE